MPGTHRFPIIHGANNPSSEGMGPTRPWLGKLLTAGEKGDHNQADDMNTTAPLRRERQRGAASAG